MIDKKKDGVMKEKVVAVVGAGTMGTDIALDLSIHKYRVILKDLSDELLQRAEERIRKNYKLMRLMKNDIAETSVEEILSRIRLGTDYEGFDNADIVLENIPEVFELKKRLFLEMKNFCKKDVIYGTNTSCISITKIGALTPKPENVIGMHFLNPVPLKNLVEVIRGLHTSDETIDRTKNFLKSIGKNWIVVNDFPGFVTNRVLMLTINECVRIVQDKVANPNDVDKIFKFGFDHKMGPLATADLIGLDTILNSLEVLYKSYNDPKFSPCPLLRKMVDAGYHGRKTGKGFFEYKT